MEAKSSGFCQAVYGEVFDEPGTVELGTLKYLCDLGKLAVTGEDLRRLVLFHKTRNTLAHLQTVDYTEVEELLRFAAGGDKN